MSLIDSLCSGLVSLIDSLWGSGLVSSHRFSMFRSGVSHRFSMFRSGVSHRFSMFRSGVSHRFSMGSGLVSLIDSLWFRSGVSQILYVQVWCLS